MFSEARMVLLGIVTLTVLTFGIGIGYRLQAGKVARAEQARDAAKADTVRWREVAGQWEQAEGLWAKRYAADQAEAKRQRKAGDEALAELAKSKAVADREAASWRQRFTNAQRNPDCAELMKVTSCPAFSNY